jgi:hypothetical protein
VTGTGWHQPQFEQIGFAFLKKHHVANGAQNTSQNGPTKKGNMPKKQIHFSIVFVFLLGCPQWPHWEQ